MTKGIPHMASIPDREEVEAEKEKLAYQKQFRSTLRSALYILVIVAAVSVLLATLFLPVLRVSGTSMEPTLKEQDVIVLVKTGKLETGDLVGFYYQNKLLLRRVIAGSGDWVDIDADGNVSVNEKRLDEPYVTDLSPGETDRAYPYQVPDEQYFVLGDNRLTSVDSRSSSIGCIETDQILGKVFFRVWPLTKISFIH